MAIWRPGQWADLPISQVWRLGDFGKMAFSQIWQNAKTRQPPAGQTTYWQLLYNVICWNRKKRNAPGWLSRATGRSGEIMKHLQQIISKFAYIVLSIWQFVKYECFGIVPIHYTANPQDFFGPPAILLPTSLHPKISKADYERLRHTDITVDDITIYDKMVAMAEKDPEFVQMVFFELIRIAPSEWLTTQLIDDYERIKGQTGPKTGPKYWGEEEWMEFARKAKEVDKLAKSTLYEFAIRDAGLDYCHQHFNVLKKGAKKLGYL